MTWLSFNPRFTIESSLSLPLRLHGICPRKRISEEVAALLKRVGLGPEHARRYPHELSGGQLQRVAVARAISVKPRIIVADEPVSKLDVSVRAQVLNLLKRMNRETGCLLADVDCGRVIDPGKLAGLNGQGMDDSSAARDR